MWLVGAGVVFAAAARSERAAEREERLIRLVVSLPERRGAGQSQSASS